MEPVDGFAAQTVGAAVIQVATSWGLPVSTTHVISGSVMGAGATRRLTPYDRLCSPHRLGVGLHYSRLGYPRGPRSPPPSKAGYSRSRSRSSCWARQLLLCSPDGRDESAQAPTLVSRRWTTQTLLVRKRGPRLRGCRDGRRLHARS
jgi:hypothetical protein